MTPIPRLHRPDPRIFFDEYVREGHPAVIAGCMNWPILDLDIRTLIDPQKSVVVTEDETGLYGPGHSKKIMARFGELLKKWESRDRKKCYYYMDQQPIGNAHPELMALLGYPQFIDRERLIAVNLWLGEGRIRWHYDGVDNFLAHVRGSKSVRLIAPEKLSNMYVFGGQWSAIDDVDRVDLAIFPRAAGIGETFDTVLEQGDMLFIPAGWWHTATTLSDWGASINFWYETHYGARRSAFVRPFFSAIENLTHLLAEEVPEHERLHYCRYAREMIDRIANGHFLPMKSSGGWDNPKQVDFTPVANRVPPRYPDRSG